MAVKNGYLLEARGIRKSFSGVEVLHGVDFLLENGEIHGLAGANGAGKSTLMKILNGVYHLDGGQIYLNGKIMAIKTPIEAAGAGIAMVFQEFSLISTMTVAENIFLAREPLHRILFINKEEIHARTLKVLERLKVDIDPDETLGNLSVGTRQIVEIAKALSKDCRVLILDEPTASLSQSEILIFFRILATLKEQGISIIMITHHLQEIMDICDRITVLRDGNVTLREKIDSICLEDVIKALAGQTVNREVFSRVYKSYQGGTPCLEVKGLRYASLLSGIDFSLYKGEVLGFAGLLGSGRTEILKNIYGLLHPSGGEILINTKNVRVKHPADAQKEGVNFVPEDRHKNGIIRGQSLMNNIMLSVWKEYTHFLFLRLEEAAKKVGVLIKRLKIKTQGWSQLIEQLSGGNQQKAVIARAIAANTRILLLDEPTVGVDIASKQEILSAVRQFADENKAVIIVSSEMEELAQVCDRVLVIKEGRIIKEFNRRDDVEITEDILMAASQGRV